MKINKQLTVKDLEKMISNVEISDNVLSNLNKNLNKKEIADIIKFGVRITISKYSDKLIDNFLNLLIDLKILKEHAKNVILLKMKEKNM